MKKTITFRSISKKAILAALATSLFFSSCKKNNDAMTTDTSVTDDEIAEAISQSVSASSGGMVMQSESTARLASTTTLTCGGSSDTTIAGQNGSGALILYSYNLHFTRSLVCTNGVPSQFNSSFTGANSYTAVRMSSADNSSAQMAVTGLQPSAAAYVMNENYVRSGTQQSHVRLQRSIASTITITSSNVTVSKTTQKIISGTATVQFAGGVTGGAGGSRGGTLTFLGNSQATLTLNNGGSYNIQW